MYACIRCSHPTAPSTHTHTHTHYCETNGQQLSFRVSESSSVGHQTRQSMSDANRHLSAVQGERKRHILHPFTTVSNPRQPRRALSQGPVKDRHKCHLCSAMGCGNVSEPSPQSPCTTVSVNEACGVTSYDQPALYGGVCTGGGKTAGNEDSMHHHWCITHTHCPCGCFYTGMWCLGTFVSICPDSAFQHQAPLIPSTVRLSGSRHKLYASPAQNTCLFSQRLIAETTTHRFAGIW